MQRKQPAKKRAEAKAASVAAAAEAKAARVAEKAQKDEAKAARVAAAAQEKKERVAAKAEKDEPKLAIEKAFQESAQENGHCLNEKCLALVQKYSESDVLALLQSVSIATGLLFGVEDMTKLLNIFVCVKENFTPAQ